MLLSPLKCVKGWGILMDSVLSLRMINLSEKYVMLCSNHFSISQIPPSSDGSDATLKNICKSRQVQVPLINYRRSNQIWSELTTTNTLRRDEIPITINDNHFHHHPASQDPSPQEAMLSINLCRIFLWSSELLRIQTTKIASAIFVIKQQEPHCANLSEQTLHLAHYLPSCFYEQNSLLPSISLSPRRL